jgi:hypothetical protein
MPLKNIDLIENAISLKVRDNNFFKTGIKILSGQGYIAQLSEWSVVN